MQASTTSAPTPSFLQITLGGPQSCSLLLGEGAQVALSTFHQCLRTAKFPSPNAVLPMSSLPLGPRAPRLASCLPWQTQQLPTWGITDGERSRSTVLWLEKRCDERLWTQSPLAEAYGSTLQPCAQALCGRMQPGPLSKKTVPEKPVQGHASQPSCSPPATTPCSHGWHIFFPVY